MALSRQVALFDPKFRSRRDGLGAEDDADSHPALHRRGRSALWLSLCPRLVAMRPPVIRPDLAGVVPSDEGHLVVYNVYHTVGDGSAEALVDWARRRRISVRAYGFPAVERGDRGLVEFKPSSRDGMLNDMATSRGVMTSAD